MTLLDEHVRADQRLVLQRWRMGFRQIGREVGWAGMKDENILPFLLTLKAPTFFTHDHGFFQRRFSHSGYCLVVLTEPDTEAAAYIRRFLQHHLFDTTAKRAGIVACVHKGGIRFWQRRKSGLQRADW